MATPDELGFISPQDDDWIADGDNAISRNAARAAAYITQHSGRMDTLTQWSKDQDVKISQRLRGDNTGQARTLLAWERLTKDYVSETVGDDVGAAEKLIAYTAEVVRLIDGLIHEGQLPDLSHRYARVDGSVPVKSVKLGRVQLDFLYGNGGDRVQLRGIPGLSDGKPAPMPYFEVAAAREGDGTDVGGAIGGYQAHWIGDGTTPSHEDRLYWGVELTNLSKTYYGRDDLKGMVQIFVSSRNKVPLRAMVFAANGRPAMVMHGKNKPYVEILRGTGFVIDDRTWPDAPPGDFGTPVVFRREGQIGLKMEGFGDWSAQPRIMLGKQSGTVADPRLPSTGHQVGALEFGYTPNVQDSPMLEHFNSAAQVEGEAIEDWTAGKRGSAINVFATPAGTTTRQRQLRIQEPSTNEAGILLRVNKDGITTEQRVLVGPPDSAGPGYRALRINN